MTVNPQVTPAQGGQDFLSPDKVAAQLDCSAHFVRKHYLRFGGIKVGDLVRIPVDYLDHLRAADEAAASQPGRAAS